MNSHGVRTLTLDQSQRRSAAWWPWLFYALFHGSSTHDLRHLDISAVTTTRRCVQRIASLVDAPNVMEQLALAILDEQAESNAQDVQRIRATRVALPVGTTLYFENGVSSPVSATLAHDIELDAFEDDPMSSTVAAVVPGYGLCRVERVAAAANPRQSPKTEAGWKLRNHSINSLVIAYRDDGLDDEDELWDDEDDSLPTPPMELLSTIGSPLLSLEICLEDHQRFRQQDMTVLVRACPSLQRLTLTRGVIDFSVIVEGYQQGLRVEALALDQFMLLEERSIEDLERALSDPSAPMSQHLREIRISCSESVDSFDRQLVRAMTRVLQTNNRLRVVSLNAYTEVVSELTPQLEAFHNQPLVSRRAPLHMRRKSAFLSVINWHCQNISSSRCLPAITHLDSGVVGVIFSFAAECEHRAVFLDDRGPIPQFSEELLSAFAALDEVDEETDELMMDQRTWAVLHA
ncbi:hypothetical protein PINS_up017200 [Pythium insidiosum]|nr:hypothetical protein PINS_up017200 [Pythium insidiosum]